MERVKILSLLRQNKIHMLSHVDLKTEKKRNWILIKVWLATTLEIENSMERDYGERRNKLRNREF